MTTPRPNRRQAKDQPTETAALQRENEELRLRLEEAEGTIAAIRGGAVDAFIIQEDGVDRVYSLQTADRPYRVLVENMPEGALVLGRDGVVLFANRRVEELTGAGEKIVGALFAAWIAPKYHDAFRALLEAGRTAPARAEVCVVRGDGTEMPALMAASPLPASGDEAVCVIVTDLTRERQREALERGEAELRHSEEQLRLADRRKDEFLATLAHELRNPLAPVRSLLEVLRIKGESSPDAEGARGVIERQVLRMAKLVDDLVDLTRISNGRMELAREPVNMTEVIRNAVEACTAAIDEAGHQLHLQLPAEPLVVEGDAARLTQVFANLLNNAVRFTPRFGHIDIDAVKERGHVVVRVRDTGDGIPEDLKGRVFEMFMQAQDGGRHPQAGLGIGLALVRQLVTMHGGTVRVDSLGAGEGSTFTVELPASGAAAAPAVAAPEIVAQPETALRILIVDDSVDSADALATMLRLNGHDVRTAYDGKGCLAVGAEFEPNVILLDVGMPGIDGYETCRRLRQEEWGNYAHVIAVTGWGQPADRRRTADAGFDHHLVKPVDPADLRDLLARLVPRRHSPWPEL